MKTFEELFEEFKQIQYGGNKWGDYHEDDLECAFRYALEIGGQQILDSIRDMAVVDWTYSEIDKDDAKMMIHKMICWNNKVALDPAASKEARELVEIGRKQGIDEAAEVEIDMTGESCAIRRNILALKEKEK